MTSRRLTTAALFAAAALAGGVAAQPPAPPAVSAAEEKARELFAAGKFDDALKELQSAVKQNPKLPPPRVTLADLFFKAKQGAAARQNLEAAAAEDPKHPDVYLLNASFAFGEGRFTDAVLSCQAALALAADPRWDADQRKRYAREARLGLAASFERRRDFAAARDQLTVVLADEPKNGPVRVRLGNALFLAGKPEEAFAEFQTARRDDPASDIPELQMAALFIAQGAADKAEEWLKKAVAAGPADAKPHRTYAGWLLDQGKVAEAQVYVDSAARLDPASPELASLRGLYHRYKKEFALAEPIFEKLHRESPANTFAAWNLALTLAESGDKEKIRRAVEMAEAEVKKNPRAGEGYVVLGWCYYKAGRMDEAEKALVAAAQLGALSRDGAYYFAKVMADKQRVEDAVRTLKAAAEARGAYVYRDDAQALLADLEKRLPAKK